MDLSTYLPIIVGVILFVATFIIRSKIRGKDKQEPLSSASTKSVNSGSEAKAVVIEKPLNNYGPLHIYFGSQTGAAQNFAKILSEEAMKAGFDPQVLDLADFHPEFFKDVKLALFTIATHGEGEPTENAKKFSEFLGEAERHGAEFQGMQFSVFALGNKQYQFYCGQGKRVNQFLEKLGGSRVYKYGEGDDNENLEDDFNSWKEGIWAELAKISKDLNQELPAGEAPKAVNKSANALPFNLVVSKDLKELESFDGLNDSKEYDFQAKQYIASSMVDITGIRELRQKTSDGSTLHVELNSGAAGVTYKTAYNLGIYPENNPEIVAKAASVLGFDLDDVFEITQNPDAPSKGKFKHPVPSPISVKTYLTKFCDLQSALRKKQLKDLAPFCSNEDNKNKLLFLASNEGKAEYEIQVQSRMKGLLDIIEEFDVKLPLSDLIQISSLILPRLYTIASSHKKSPNSIDLCVSLQNDRLPDGKTKTGMTADFLIRKQKIAVQEGKGFGKARINIRESTFSLPTDAANPIIMVGPGAGIAPFKGLIDEKAHLAQLGGENTYGEMTLYFGCKGQDWDYLYKEELTKYKDDGVITNLHLAFSRATDKKVYVQDLLVQNKDQTIKLLFESNAVFYMCGSMAMGKDVIGKLGELAASYYNVDLKEGQKKIEEMEKAKKIIKELWG